MKINKIKWPLAVLLFVCAAALSAQTVHEPNSGLYKDIDTWLVQGYIGEFIPLVRPYPLRLIDKILDDVINNGDAQARAKAASYREALAPGSRIIHPGVTSYVQGKNGENGILGSLFAEGSARLTGMLNVSYHFAAYGMTDVEGERFNIPGTYTPYPDFISDTSNIGKMEIRQNWTSLVALGTSDVYLQAGLARSSFGPFYDNGIVVGPQAPRAGHFSFAFLQPRWSYEMLFQTITATDDFGEGFFGNKYNIIHVLDFRPVDTLEMGFMQTLVWGGAPNFLYMVPFSFLFASQSISDFEENSFMGLFFRWRPFDTFLVSGQVYVDDFSFNGLFSGEKKNKLAYEAGVSWAPRGGFFSKLDFDYTAVFPYCYTHWSLPNEYIYTSGKPNYYNYTHLGRNIGPDLDPNSDRISVRTAWNIHPRVDLNVGAYLIRHANASYYDGSVFDHGTLVDDSGEKRSYNKNSLKYGWYLTQGLIGARLGGSLGASWSLPTSFGVFKLSGGYGAQYSWNRWGPGQEPQKDDNGLDHFWSVGGMWSW